MYEFRSTHTNSHTFHVSLSLEIIAHPYNSSICHSMTKVAIKNYHYDDDDNDAIVVVDAAASSINLQIF